MIKSRFIILIGLLAIVSKIAIANDMVFVKALREGIATAPMPSSAEYTASIKLLKAQAGNQSDLYIQAKLVERFTQQSRCGRVGFMVIQPETKKTWPGVGGELNICEDGTPPWRICEQRPEQLVSPDTKCSDGRPQVNSEEVQAAIERSLKRGTLSAEQARAEIVKLQKQRAAAAK